MSTIADYQARENFVNTSQPNAEAETAVNLATTVNKIEVKGLEEKTKITD